MDCDDEIIKPPSVSPPKVDIPQTVAKPSTLESTPTSMQKKVLGNQLIMRPNLGSYKFYGGCFKSHHKSIIIADLTSKKAKSSSIFNLLSPDQWHEELEGEKSNQKLASEILQALIIHGDPLFHLELLQSLGSKRFLYYCSGQFSSFVITTLINRGSLKVQDLLVTTLFLPNLDIILKHNKAHHLIIYSIQKMRNIMLKTKMVDKFMQFGSQDILDLIQVSKEEGSSFRKSLQIALQPGISQAS